MEITIEPMQTADDAAAFRELNEQWIAATFALEPEDVRVLADPFAIIVAPGGAVLVARSGGAVVGCVALVPAGEDEFELAKMAVSPGHRGGGIGRRLLKAALDRAAELGARRLTLGSSTRLPDAVHLYESLGFTHIPTERLEPMPYVRADVFMERAL